MSHGGDNSCDIVGRRHCTQKMPPGLPDKTQAPTVLAFPINRNSAWGTVTIKTKSTFVVYLKFDCTRAPGISD